ncbi:MAG: glycoside hydrolase family 2 TIM barrel-domain containing protein [Oscillospiraceae bacterium]|nr:glycoside hydrolase family 2 TIM barrel-domain containing protein [Oscillospiraceae bacterium]
MKKIDFNSGWLFCRRGEEDKAKLVSLPHDAMLLEPRSKDAKPSGAGGYFREGCYDYVKTFKAPLEWENKSVVLELEAVYMNSAVYLNGELVAERPYGYSNYFVTLDSGLRYGEENELKVVADNSNAPNSRWYSGAGIIRPVSLHIGGKAHIVPDSMHIEAGQDGKANVEMEVTGGDLVKVTVCRNGKEAAAACGKVQNGTVSLELTVQNPDLWDAENPNLYTCEAVLFDGETETDCVSVDFGFRTVSWGKDGFKVNGKEVLFRGACVHHDNGILGACAFDEAEERRVRILKEAGFNAIRSAHNPAAKSMLDACDRLGMYVMDESFDMWVIHKNPGDYGGDTFREWWQRDTEAMIRKDWSHPSVVMYSIGNEISDLGAKEGQDYCKLQSDFVRATDPSRAVTIGMNLMLASMVAKGKGMYGEGKETGSQSMDSAPTSEFFNMIMNKIGGLMDMAANNKGADQVVEHVSHMLDMPGYNYATSRYEKEAKLYPDRPFTGSETLPKALYRNWQLVKKIPNLTGDFMWTGWDYLGESAIGTVRYKSDSKDGLIVSGGAGVIDICGKLRPEVQWNKLIWDLTDKPAIAVEPYTRAKDKRAVSIWRDNDCVGSWAWDGCEGLKQIVRIYANGATAELIVNGKSYGRKKVKENMAIFKKVTYVPGTVTAVSYDADGKEIAKTSLTSATGKTSVRVVAEKPVLKADGNDLCFLRLELVGENGVIRSASDRKLKVEVSGAGTLQAFGSSRPVMKENFYSDTHTTYLGQALAAVRAGNMPGEIRVKVSGDGLEDQEVTIEVR